MAVFLLVRHSHQPFPTLVVWQIMAVFVLIMAEFLLVKETSAVTFSVAGTAKEVVTILVSHMVFGDRFTLVSHMVFGDRFTRVTVLGIVIIILGVSLYIAYKVSRNKARESEGHRVHALTDELLPDHPATPSDQL
ncbi:unnamed protein product [Closterium sp. NIES-65]|nr:unnamed protein product [Closterium sp. NIES-65]